MPRSVTTCCACHLMLSCFVLKENKVGLLLFLEKMHTNKFECYDGWLISIVMSVGFLFTTLVYVCL
jgi:hypothetical protein